MVNKKYLEKLSLISLLTLLSSTAAHSAGISQAELLAHQCFACHGTNGVGAGKIPELQELDKDDIMESLTGFQTGAEKSTIMDRHAKGYTEKEIEMLADYFVSLAKK